MLLSSLFFPCTLCKYSNFTDFIINDGVKHCISCILTCLGICSLDLLVTFPTGLSLQKHFPVPLLFSGFFLAWVVWTETEKHKYVISVKCMTLENFLYCFHVLVSLDGEVLKGQNFLRTQWAETCAWKGRLSHASWGLLSPETCWFREWTQLNMNPCILFLGGIQCMSWVMPCG